MSVPVCVCVRVNMHQVVVQWGPRKETLENRRVLYTTYVHMYMYVYLYIFLFLIVTLCYYEYFQLFILIDYY